MSQRDVRWVPTTRKDLPRALLDRQVENSDAFREVEGCIHVTGIAIAFDAEGMRLGDFSPLAIVIADELLVETLSWLKAFAPQTAPLSQFCRLHNLSEWKSFRVDWSGHFLTNPQARLQPLRWASVIAGELLSETEAVGKLSSIPLTHVLSCFSMTVAKASLLHDSDGLRKTCVERLRSLQEMRGAVRRSVAVQELTLMWELVRATRALADGDPLELIERATAIAIRTVPLRGVEGRLAPLLSAESGLFSDSIEERVKSFQRVLNQLSDMFSDGSEPSANFLVATAAFLVGRGTSHVFLLQRCKERWPAALAWFGTIAALTGPELWDAEWARMTRGIEKLLRTGLDDWTISSADLSWLEYLWLNQIYEGKEGLTDFPRMQVRTLSVELVPGASCQFRLGAEPISQSHDTERVVLSQMKSRIRELEGIVESFISLAHRSRQSLEDRTHADRALRTPRGQVTFHFDEDDSRRIKTSKKPLRKTSE